MANFFEPNWRYKTANNEINLLGAVEKYFDAFTSNCNEDTKRSYFLDYSKRIFPLVNQNKSMTSYTKDDIEDLCELIQNTLNYNDSTLKTRYNHLVYSPYYIFCE